MGGMRYRLRDPGGCGRHQELRDRQETDHFLDPPEGAQPLWHLDLELRPREPRGNALLMLKPQSGSFVTRPREA